MLDKNKKKNVAVIGGGNGSAVSVKALKQNLDRFDISAIISMSDSGGSSGRLRKEFDTLPMGDIMRAILAMSKYDYNFLKPIFYKTRFENSGKLDGHNLGNLFLVLAEKYGGSLEDALCALHQAVEAVGTAYPVTLEKSDLCVELTNGEKIMGEHEIDRPNYDKNLKIKKIWLEPNPKIYESARDAIKKADAIILGPGSLYCSVIANLVVEGVWEAIEKSKAELIYVSGNAHELEGETGPENLSDFISQLENYLPRPLDAIVYNNFELTDREKEFYKDKKWKLINFDKENLHGRHVICGDYEKDETEGFGLSPKKLSKLLEKII